MPVIASGISTGTKDLEDGNKIYMYRQEIPIPSYLFALASGNIEQAKIGPRSVVVTGPNELEAAKWELEEATETYIATIENIVFPYVWQTYNVLILPPAFPYGGMENPVYTVSTFFNLQSQQMILYKYLQYSFQTPFAEDFLYQVTPAQGQGI